LVINVQSIHDARSEKHQVILLRDTKKNPCMPFLSAASHQPSIPELILNPATIIFCAFKKKSITILQ